VRERERVRAVCGSLYHFYLYENICLFYITSLLACNHFQMGGGRDDNSILWLTIAQQKYLFFSIQNFSDKLCSSKCSKNIIPQNLIYFISMQPKLIHSIDPRARCA
jgi:hypothetical protein